MKLTLNALLVASLLSLASATLASSAALAGDIVVITHPSVGIAQLSRDDVMRIFLAKTKTYPNEKPVIPVVPKENAETRRQFESVVFEKSTMQVKAYWTRLLFTGRGNPPHALSDDEEIKKKVAETPNAIGYIDSAALDDTVTAVYTIH